MAKNNDKREPDELDEYIDEYLEIYKRLEQKRHTDALAARGAMAILLTRRMDRVIDKMPPKPVSMRDLAGDDKSKTQREPDDER